MGKTWKGQSNFNKAAYLTNDFKMATYLVWFGVTSGKITKVFVPPFLHLFPNTSFICSMMPHGLRFIFTLMGGEYKEPQNIGRC